MQSSLLAEAVGTSLVIFMAEISQWNYLHFLPNLPDELPLLYDLTCEASDSHTQLHVFTVITKKKMMMMKK